MLLLQRISPEKALPAAAFGQPNRATAKPCRRHLRRPGRSRRRSVRQAVAINSIAGCPGLSAVYRGRREAPHPSVCRWLCVARQNTRRCRHAHLALPFWHPPGTGTATERLRRAAAGAPWLGRIGGFAPHGTFWRFFGNLGSLPKQATNLDLATRRSGFRGWCIQLAAVSPPSAPCQAARHALSLSGIRWKSGRGPCHFAGCAPSRLAFRAV